MLSKVSLTQRFNLSTQHQARTEVSVGARKQQQKKLRKPKNREQRRTGFDDVLFEAGEEDDDDMYLNRRPPAAALLIPEAPKPSTGTEGVKESTTDSYVVFAPKAKPSSIQSIRGGAWGWEDETETPSTSAGPPLPEWNPRTGFMGSSAVESSSGGSTSAPADDPLVQAAFLTPSSTDADLPYVSRGQILSSCLSTSFWMALLAVVIRQYSQVTSPQVLGTDPALLRELMRIPSGLETWENLGLTLGAVAVVTGVRLQLLSRWPEFRISSHRSNKQVLQPLNWFDILVVALLTGLSEEFLFRGAGIPATWPDWRGALLSGVVFGILHNNGGRNLAFAAWATLVGSLYGVLFVYTQNIWVPASAHALANLCSALAWKTQSEPGDGQR